MRIFVATARPILADLAGTLAFYLVYLVSGSAPLGAAVGLVIGLGQVGYLVAKRQRPSGLLVVGLALTLGLGGMTFLNHDPRFMLVKPSIVCAIIGVTMLQRGWLTRYAPPIARSLLSDRVFDWVGWCWSGLMFTSAAVNLLALALLPPHSAALVFTIWATGSKTLLFVGQYIVLRMKARRIYRQREAEGSLPPEATAAAKGA